MSSYREDDSTFSTSFLDVVCSGFGAAIFLFIIFAALPITPSGGMLGSSQYLDIDMRWSSNSGNGRGIFELVLQPPYSDELYVIARPNFTVSPVSGQLGYGDKKEITLRGLWQTAFLSGASVAGESVVDKDGENVVRMRIIDPCPGQWKVYFNHHNDLKSSISSVPETYNLRFNVHTEQHDVRTEPGISIVYDSLNPSEHLGKYFDRFDSTVSTLYQLAIPDDPDDTDDIKVHKPKLPVKQNHCR